MPLLRHRCLAAVPALRRRPASPTAISTVDGPAGEHPAAAGTFFFYRDRDDRSGRAFEPDEALAVEQISPRGDTARGVPSVPFPTFVPHEQNILAAH